MERTKRIMMLHQMFLSQQAGMTIQRMMELVECERATLYRDLAYMENELGAPIVHDGKSPRSYGYAHGTGAVFHLPGLWMGPAELYGLRMAEQVFQQSGAATLEEKVGKVQHSARKVLQGNARELRRLRIIRTRDRRIDSAIFRHIAQATFDRCQLSFRYKSRTSDRDRAWQVSPQLLTHYRDNWYLDGWDAQRENLIIFSIDRIREPQVLSECAVDLPDAQLDAHQASGYGIFAGPIIGTACIRFSPHAARWVCDEHWHDEQRMHLLPDGSLELRIPYANPRELIMDILRLGKDAQILGPPELREAIRKELVEAAGLYAE